MAIQSWQQSFLPGNGYGDSWDPKKNYFSVGYYPGQALQSRELLEMQTILFHQISTTNRSLFKHGQPRIDLEEDSLTDSNLSPIVRVGTNGFLIRSYSQFFTNFSLSAANVAIPNGIWLTFPQDDYSQIVNMSAGDYMGFVVGRITTVTHEDDATLLDPANGYANSNAPGANRVVYELRENDDGLLIVSPNKRQQGSFFVPLVYYSGTAYYWAFDESTQIPTI